MRNADQEPKTILIDLYGWYTCPNDCPTTIERGSEECPHCGQKLLWPKSERVVEINKTINVESEGEQNDQTTND